MTSPDTEVATTVTAQPAANDATWLDADQERHWRALVQLCVALPAELDRQLRRDASLCHAHWVLLVHLADADDATRTMSELATAGALSASACSHAVRALEGRGLVTRRPAEHDRRVQLATLTDAGRAAMAAAAPGHVRTVRDLVVERLTDDQLRTLGGLAATLLDGLDRIGRLDGIEGIDDT